MSDSPCSVPDWLRVLLPLETELQQAACRDHDKAYEAGGDRRTRLAVDLTFCQALLEADMEPDRAEQYFWGVRQYGAVHWHGDDHGGAQPPHPPQPAEAP